LIDAYAQQTRRDSIDNHATGAEDVTPLQRRADALNAPPSVTADDTAVPVFALETRYASGPDLFTAVSTGPPGTG